jgi:sterol desaturase/sphingolipid hydroxylase (fatty acid hydroxylase superfamily)
MTYFFLAVLVGIEFAMYRLKNKAYMNIEAYSSLFASVVNTKIFNLLAFGFMLKIYLFFYSLRVFNINSDSLFVYSLVFILVDFGYYWIHRCSHNVRFFWTAHEIHHYPNGLTILNAVSQSLIEMFFNLQILLFILLAIVGFHPRLILTCFAINLAGQAWLHTEYIPRLGFLEKIINTPNLHRIHHSLSKKHIGKNYGGVFIIFDRLFKTYSDLPQCADFIYGTVPAFEATSILSTWQREFRTWFLLYKDFRQASGLENKLGVLFVIND